MTTKSWIEHWPVEVPLTLDYPKVPLFQLVKEASEAFPSNTAYIWQNESTSYDQLYAQIKNFAATLHTLGVKYSDKVALFLPNHEGYLISFFAVNMIGAIVVPCNAAYREKEMKFLLKESEAETIVVLDELYPIVKDILEETSLKNIVVIGKEATPNTFNFYEMVSTTQEEPPKVDIKAEDIAVLAYTGGTTSTPKGALLTNFNLVSNALVTAKWFNFEEGRERTIAVLPLSHIYGLSVAMNATLFTAGTIVLMSKFHSKKVLEAISNYKLTFIPGVPTMYIALLHYPELEKYDLSSLRFALSGGASLPVQVMKEFSEKTGCNLLEGYGLTEASPVTHTNPISRKKGGSIGIPVIDCFARIVDENGNDVPFNERGELMVSGPMVMQGYWKNSEETKRALVNGELHTGDIATMDEEGYFAIVDRKKDMINVAGYKVYPRDVEEVLFEHPKVMSAAVIGVPDEYTGEKVIAYIVLKEGQSAIDHEIINFCEEKIAKFKIPKIIEFREALPMTGVGKVLRRALREEVKGSSN